MIRKLRTLQLISISLNVFFLIYMLNSYFWKKKPRFYLENVQVLDETNASYEFEGIEVQNKEKIFKVTQRGRYFVLNNYVRSSRKFDWNESVTYATHSDHTFLENLVTLTERWDAPVSVAVHAPGHEFARVLSSIIYLRSCSSPKLKELVTFHFYFRDGNFPKDIPPPWIVDSAEANCDIPPSRGLDRKSFPYPINVARNVARENSATRHLLVSDIELIPSPGLAGKFLKFVNSRAPEGKPAVYPIPVFEIMSGMEVPENKTELVKMMKTGKAQIFHKRICSRCHRIPKFEKWLDAREGEELNVFHVAKREGDLSEWEPIYIGTNDEPFYDERLMWEGKRDKMTQGYVMCLLDYEFHILDNAFLTHKPGMKKMENNLLRDYVVGKTLEKIESVIVPQMKTLFGHREGCKFMN